MKINISHRDKIEKAIRKEEGLATARLLDYQRVIKAAEKRLTALRIPKGAHQSARPAELVQECGARYVRKTKVVFDKAWVDEIEKIYKQELL